MARKLKIRKTKKPVNINTVDFLVTDIAVKLWKFYGTLSIFPVIKSHYKKHGLILLLNTVYLFFKNNIYFHLQCKKPPIIPYCKLLCMNNYQNFAMCDNGSSSQREGDVHKKRKKKKKQKSTLC